MNKIAGMKRNGCSIPYLTKNKFCSLFLYKKKGMIGNALFFVVRWSTFIPIRLVTILEQEERIGNELRGIKLQE